jgi:hypothetical protein
MEKELKDFTHDDLDSVRNNLIKSLSELPRHIVFELSEAARLAHQNTVKDANTKRLRKKSGAVKDERLLVAFLYVLMRDTVPPGVIEGTLLKLSNENAEDKETKHEYMLTNGYLAKYAQDIADRLEAGRLTGQKEQGAYPDPFKR